MARLDPSSDASVLLEDDGETTSPSPIARESFSTSSPSPLAGEGWGEGAFQQLSVGEEPCPMRNRIPGNIRDANRRSDSVVGTFKQQGSSNTFVPYLPTMYIKTAGIDFKTDRGSLPIQNGTLKFTATSGSIAYNATDGYYEAAGSATGRLTFPTKLRTKITVEPIALTWETKTFAGLTNISNVSTSWYNLERIGFDGSKLLAVSTTGHVATSIDGISWTRQGDRSLFNATGQGGGWYMGATYGNGIWVAVRTGGHVATSSNGIDWASRGKPLSGDFQTSLFFANGIFMTQDASTRFIWTSEDGITWTQRGKLSPGYARLLGYSMGRWIAGNVYGSIDDGYIWTRIDESLGVIYGGSSDGNYKQQWYGTCFVGGKHYAINYSGEQLALSLDGSNWKNLGTTPSFKDFRNITYLNGKFISLHQDGGSLFVTNAGSRSVQFSGLSPLVGGTTNEEYQISASREFIIEASQISDDADSDGEYHIDFDMTQVRLVSAEIFREPTPADNMSTSLTFYSAAQINQAGNKVVAAIAPDPRFSLAETKIHLLEGSTVLANFVCDSQSIDDGMISLGVQADLGTRTVELKGDWSKFQAAPFTTTGTGTLKIATAASLPQSKVTIRDRGALEFTGNLDYTTGAGTTLDLRGCSSVSGGKSLTLGAGARLIF